MKLLNGILVSALCICVAGSGVASAGETAYTAPVVSAWTADHTACQPVTVGNVAALAQLAQIGKGEPDSAAWSPDGTVVALSTGTGVHLFDGYSMRLLGILQSGLTSAMAWSQDGALLALVTSVSAGDEIQVWDVAAREKKYAITQTRVIEDLYIDQKNNSLLALGQSQIGADKYGAPRYKAFLDTYNLKTGKKKADSVSFSDEGGSLMMMSLSNGGGYVFGAGLSKCYLWNAKGHLFYSAATAFPLNCVSESGATISVILDWARPNSLQIIDRKTKKKTASVSLPYNVGKMELDEEAQEVILYTLKGYLVYSLETQELVANEAYYKNFGGTLWLSRDRGRAFQISGSLIRLIDLNAETVLGEQNGYESQVSKVAVSADRLAASKGSSYNNDVRLLLWDFDTLQSIAAVKGKELSATIQEILFLPDETELLTYGWGEDTLKLWNAADGSKARDIATDGSVQSVSVSKDGSALAIGHAGYAGVLPLDGAGRESVFAMVSFVGSVSLSEDGGRAAACDGECLVVWDAVVQSDVLFVSDENLAAAVISDAGTQVAALYSGENGYTVKMLDAQTGKPGWTHKLPKRYFGMRFTPDGSMLAISAYHDGLIFLDAQTGQEVFTLKYSVCDFEFSQDGRIIVTASADGTIRLWGVAGGSRE